MCFCFLLLGVFVVGIFVVWLGFLWGFLVAVVGAESAPVKRMIQEARDGGNLIDATYGRRTRAVLVMDSTHIILSSLQPETLAVRMGGRETENDGEEEAT